MSPFQLLMRLIKPSDKRLRLFHSQGRLVRFLVKSYQALLKRLMKSYTYYAMSDTLLEDGDHVKIIHECQDVGNEKELLRNRVDVRPQLLSDNLPMRAKRKGYGINHHFFKFRDVVSVCINDKELFLRHGNLLSVDGTAIGELKCSAPEDVICRTVVKIIREYACEFAKRNHRYEDAICLAPAVYRRSIIRQQWHLIDKKFKAAMPGFKIK